MKNILLATTTVFAMSGAAFAAVSDGDGMASMAELQVMYPDVTEEIFLAIDVNADGFADDAEITAATEAGVLVAE